MSICLKSPDRYHDMFTVANTSKELVERCKYCGYQVVQHKSNNNQKQYIEAHAKDLLQPGTNEFKRVYGEKQEREILEKQADANKHSKEMENWKEEIADYKKWQERQRGLTTKFVI